MRDKRKEGTPANLANGENVLSHDYSANDHEARVQLIAGTLGGPPGRFPYAVTFKEQQAARSAV